MDKGLMQIYCGNGKGKTTAAIGQGIRAVGQGLKVIMVQFLKGRVSGEVEIIKKLEPDMKLLKFEKQTKFYYEMSEDEKSEHVKDVKNGIGYAKKVLDTGECDVLILDELLGVLELGIITKEEFKAILLSKPQTMELVITGRILPEEFYPYADYITKFEPIKHPYERQILARRGIEF